ncbi:MAG: hypothetical protein QM757_44110 [Paludibaculum sp.]
MPDVGSGVHVLPGRSCRAPTTAAPTHSGELKTKDLEGIEQPVLGDCQGDEITRFPATRS